jgi:hypothetical protein
MGCCVLQLGRSFAASCFQAAVALQPATPALAPRPAPRPCPYPCPCPPPCSSGAAAQELLHTNECISAWLGGITAHRFASDRYHLRIQDPFDEQDNTARGVQKMAEILRCISQAAQATAADTSSAVGAGRALEVLFPKPQTQVEGGAQRPGAQQQRHNGAAGNDTQQQGGRAGGRGGGGGGRGSGRAGGRSRGRGRAGAAAAAQQHDAVLQRLQGLQL